MPVSTSVHISECLHHIISLQPRSVLDVGCGFGLWGFLCREYLDVMNERVQPETWQIRIDGLELFEPYIQKHHAIFYNHIQIADIREAASSIDSYDLIIAGDVIEHLHKDEGLGVVDALYAKAQRALLVNIPLGWWEHPENHGNPGELHRSEWRDEDFAPYPAVQQHFTLPAGDYGVFFCPKDVQPEVRVEGLNFAAQYRLERGELDWAEHYALQARGLAPQSPEAAVALAEVCLRTDRMLEAEAHMNAALQADPSFHYGYIALAQLQLRRNDAKRARDVLQTLLARHDIENEYKMQAERLLAGIRKDL